MEMLYNILETGRKEVKKTVLEIIEELASYAEIRQLEILFTFAHDPSLRSNALRVLNRYLSHMQYNLPQIDHLVMNHDLIGVLLHSLEHISSHD